MSDFEKLTSPKDLTGILADLEQISSTPETIEDLPPEFCTYKDEGCELADACLECPLPQCTLDLPLVSMNKAQRDPQIRRLYAQEGVTVPELAGQFGICERTVWRAIRARKG